ncbi:MAG: squalene/phytoene synthase family protein, partial [Myxococcota bacterium]
QLTNIIRDVGEDARLGRIYLPLEDLAAFGVSEEDILAGRDTPAVAELLHFEARRAAEYYVQAEAALPPATRRRLFFAEALRKTYKRLLGEMIKRKIPSMRERVSIPAHVKLAIALRARMHPATWMVGA